MNNLNFEKEDLILKKLICAVDTANIDDAIDITKSLKGIAGFKVGLEFFSANLSKITPLACPNVSAD